MMWKDEFTAQRHRAGTASSGFHQSSRDASEGVVRCVGSPNGFALSIEEAIIAAFVRKDGDTYLGPLVLDLDVATKEASRQTYHL